MNKQLILTCFLISAICFSLDAQKLLKPFNSISHKKTTYIVKKDGSEIQGTVKKLKRKKGLVKQITIKNEKGEKMTIPIEDIKHAYLPQSGWDKFTKFDSFLSDATQWEDGLYDKERLKEGYAYFETATVKVKKKEMTLLVQLLNPGACSRVKVYDDPFAAETASVGVAGIKLAGGNDKSYYISKDGATSYKLQKKKYRKEFDNLFGDCKSVKKEYKGGHWEDFVKALFKYNGDCAK